MRAIKLKAVIDDRATLEVKLPSDVPSGTVEVIILLDQEVSPSAALTGDSFDELLDFHRGHTLDGITLQELVAEGRR